MTERYFAETPITGGSVTLAGTEAHHLVHVMRAGPGDRVVLFDGSGAEFTARVERVDRSTVELTILSRREVDRELSLKLTLGVSLPRGGRQRWLVEKAVELGVSRLVPLATSRSVAQVSQKALARLRRTVIEASKQCGRNRLMEVSEPQAWSDFIAATQTVSCRLLAEPDRPTPLGGGLPTSPKRAGSGGPRTAGNPRTTVKSVGLCDAAVLAVGPEGGFTDDEVALATASGWQPVDLGPRILRTETAAIFLVNNIVFFRVGGPLPSSARQSP